jgi:hypothetical protein
MFFRRLMFVCLFATCLWGVGYIMRSEIKSGKLPKFEVLRKVKINRTQRHDGNGTKIKVWRKAKNCQSQTKGKIAVGDHWVRDLSNWRGFPPNRYILNNPTICLEEKPELIVVVTSSIPHFEHRQLIRKYWGSKESKIKNNMAVVYIFGTTLDGARQDRLLQEKMHYNDVIQIEFLDTYRNLTNKSVAMLKWINDFCPSAIYVLKSDDDMLISPERLLIRLRKYRHRFARFFLCAVRKKVEAVRRPDYKWYMSESEFKDKYYPTHCSGTAYSFSMSAVEILLNNTLTTPPIWIEDVYISGMLATSIVHVHNKEFKFFAWNYSKPEICFYKREIAVHGLPIRKREAIYSALRKC